MEKISFSKFIKLLTSQPYFVWNNEVQPGSHEDQNLKFDIFSYQDVLAPSMHEIQAKSFNLIEKKFDKKVIANLANSHLIKSKTIADKIKETKAAMENADIEHIINPVFGFEYKAFQVLAQPKIFSKLHNEISFLKISTSTKLKDILRFMFDYLVLQALGIHVQDASLYVLKTKDYQKGKVDFYQTKYINTIKSGRSLPSELKYDYPLQQLTKTGQGRDRRDQPLEKHSIFEILQSGQIKKLKSNFSFASLNSYLEHIIAAKEIKKIGVPIAADASMFANNPHWDVIMDKSKNQWHGYSGNLIAKKTIIANKAKHSILISSNVVAAIADNKIRVTNQELIAQSLKTLEQKIVWYDFEAMSLPFAPLDHVQPFHQIVSQVAIITTNHLEEQEVVNIVLDPKHIKANDFAKIINAIFHAKHKYVVYNKAYENTRLSEMLRILGINGHRQMQALTQKVSQIIEHTIDLADYFICQKNKMPLILIPFLKGRYSIKIIEKYISQERPTLPYKIKKYQNLKIQNGMMAMEMANNRALGILGDYQWNKLQSSLKEYCENDVRAMIMVYYLIKDILKNQ